MHIVDLIKKKRDGGELTREEIDFLIENYSKEEIKDYQMAAFLMAVYFQDMSKAERKDLTMAMMNSGDVIDLSKIEGIKVDKHSTGGVGDTTTIVLAPLLASLGVPVAKMSGRGLGFTGGTIDKLEAIAGFQTELPIEKFIDLVNKSKLAVVGQTGNLAPADKKIYALRDVTATVDSIALIASSIMSKKLASGADKIVLDVKTGSGAFMKDMGDAQNLAEAMVEIGKSMQRETVALITDMNQPLGRAIGNSLEIIEAIETLKNKGPEDLRELCLELGSQMLLLAQKTSDKKEARSLLEGALESGQALLKFREFIQNQGGNPAIIDDYSLLGEAKYRFPISSETEGFINHIETELIGRASMLLGAGRESKEDSIDLQVGLVLEKKLGDYVDKGEVLATIYSNEENISESKAILLEAFILEDEKKEVPVLIKKIIK